MPPLKLTQPILIVCLATLVYYIFSRQKRRRAKRPPGPKGWPLIGNMADIPDGQVWMAYASMSKQYGDMIYLEVMGQPILVLNSLRRANDLLDKRSSNNSDRPVSYMLDVLMGCVQWNTSLMPYGERWRSYRRLLHLYYHQKMSEEHYPCQIQATHTLLRDLLDDPAHFKQHFTKQTGSIILKSTYGYDVKPRDDPYVALVIAMLDEVNEATSGGAHLVEVFHFLRFIPTWFPGAGFRRLGERCTAMVQAMLHDPYYHVKSAMAEKTAQPSFVFKFLSDLEESGGSSPEQEEAVKHVAGVGYAAGADTTLSTILTFLLGMMLNPESQKRAQAELDSVVGHDRLPSFEDKRDLPYIDCIVSESLRWQVVTPLGLAHRSIEEDVYDGYVIPAGTIITANIWAILHDENVYQEPLKFDPDRFLAKGKDGRSVLPDPAEASFGFGRRICPGRHFARNTVWITIASVLSQYNVEMEVDENGKGIVPDLEYMSGIISLPKPFKCKITPRFPEKIKHVLAAE